MSPPWVLRFRRGSSCRKRVQSTSAHPSITCRCCFALLELPQRFRFGLCFPPPQQESLHMFSTPPRPTLHSAPRMGSWFGTASTCPPSHGTRYAGVGVRLVSGVVVSVGSRGCSTEDYSGRLANGRCSAVLLSWCDSGRRLSSTCDSESESFRAANGLTLCLRYFRWVAAELASSSRVLLLLSGSRSGLTGSRGPPKRTLWRK